MSAPVHRDFFITPQGSQIQIDTSCVETEPCYHDVYKNGKFYREMDGVGIVQLLQEYQQEIPEHFNCYLNYKDVDLFD